jgi:predicted ATPase
MSASHIRFGPFLLENEPVCLSHGADPIKLRPKSLEVLVYLAERPGQLVSKEELLKRVWPGRVISDSGLRLCVCEIRTALGDDPEKPFYLKTIVGRGYRFLEGRDGRALFPDTTGPVVGRESELRQLEDYYQLVADGHRQFVLLSGEPGIGKTTLLGCFLDRVAEQSTTNVIQGQCVVHYGKCEAYGPLFKAIAGSCRGRNGATVLQVFKRFAPAWLLQIPGLLDPVEFERIQSQVEGMTPERMNREFCQAVEELAKQTPLIIVIEDLHWADISTIDLLAALAQYHEPSRLLLLGTYRPADAVLCAKHLRNIVFELRGRGQCEEMMLEFLSGRDVASYLTGRLSGDVSTELSTKVFQRTNGNPLFIVNLVEDLIQRQILVQQEGCWTFNSQAQNQLEAVPESLRLLILRRLEALPDEQKRILEAACVVGIEFTSAATASALEQATSDVDGQYESMAAQGQFIEAIGITDWPDGTLSGHYRFQHPLYFEVLYEQIGDARRAQLHRCVGERLETGYGDQKDGITAALAMHFDRGHDTDRTIRYRKIAAKQALNCYAYPEAVAQLTRALDTLKQQLPESAERDQQELEFLLHLGPCLIATGGYTTPEVEQAFSRAQVLCERLKDESKRATVLWNLAGYRMARGELVQSRSFIEQVVELANASTDDGLDLMAHDALAQQAFFEGDFSPAHVQCEYVTSRYDIKQHKNLADLYSQEDPGVVCASIDTVVLWLLGFPDQSLERTQTFLTLSRESGNPHSTGFGLFITGVVSQLRRDLLATQRQADDLIELSTGHDLHLLSLGQVLKAWAMAQQTAATEHLELIKDGINLWREPGTELLVPYCLGLLAETHQALGQIEEAQATVSEALSLVEKNSERWFESELHRLQGELILEQDSKQQTEAVKCFKQALRVAREQQARSLELRAALCLCRLWVQQGQSGEARKMLEPIFTSFTEGLKTVELRDARSLLDELVI